MRLYDKLGAVCGKIEDTKYKRSMAKLIAFDVSTFWNAPPDFVDYVTGTNCFRDCIKGKDTFGLAADAAWHADYDSGTERDSINVAKEVCRSNASVDLFTIALMAIDCFAESKKQQTLAAKRYIWWASTFYNLLCKS